MIQQTLGKSREIFIASIEDLWENFIYFHTPNFQLMDFFSKIKIKKIFWH